MIKKLTPLMMALLLSACSLSPDYQRPAVETPGAFSAASKETAINADWWTNFGSDELNGLMTQALEQNNDLRASVQRIAQSRAALKVAGASLLPTVSASGGASRNFSRPGSVRESWNGGADIGYELDLFGANRAGVDAAEANWQGSGFDHDALALVVMGDVAKGYFSLLNLRERVAIAEDNLTNAREVLRIINARFDAGSASGLDVAQQKTSVASNEASLASLQSQVTVAENALALLLGRAPQAMAFTGETLKPLKIPAIAPGQPSSLLERRPDIRGAEAQLLAANADIGAARAAFFPSITLGVGATISGDPVTKALSLVSSLATPIFQGGRLQGSLDQATARQAELVETYRKTVLTGFKEVEDTLAAAKAATAREKALAVARREAQRSYDLSLQLYKAGSIDFQTLLNTQNSLLSAQDSYAGVKLEALNAAVDLYKALGGGWSGS